MNDDHRRQKLLDEGFGRLEELLEQQRTLYRQLDTLVGEQRAAVQRADIDGLVQASSEEREIIDVIRGMDLRRAELADALASELGMEVEETPALTDLLEFSGERRSRLVTIADELRRLVVAVRTASGVVRVAAEGLARHMQGIVQTVEAGFNRAGVYERTGRLANGQSLQASIDIRS